jgi:predicted amidohydrolase
MTSAPRTAEEGIVRKIRIAAAQLGPIDLADDRPSVVLRLCALLREAHGLGAKLVVFPELALTTFFPRYWYDELSAIDAWFEREMPNAATEPLFALARELGVGFYLGYAELASEGGATHRYNTSILVGADGAIIGKYRKIHLPGHADHRENLPFQHLEKRYFEVGNLGFPVWRAFGGVIGMLICNDRRWPEAYRVMGLQGVELVLLGYNTPTANIYHPEPEHLRMFHHRLSVQAGAYQNGCWVVAVAKAGAEDGHGLIGGSCIVAPTGEIVAQALSERDEVTLFDCDLELCSHYKKTVFAFEKHRRIEHYRLITERAGAIPPPERG